MNASLALFNLFVSMFRLLSGKVYSIRKMLGKAGNPVLIRRCINFAIPLAFLFIVTRCKYGIPIGSRKLNRQDEDFMYS